MWNREPKLYRKTYYAETGTGNNKKRKSLRTKELGIAVLRLADLRRRDTETTTLIKDIYMEYKAEKENQYGNLGYIWNNLAPVFGDLRPDQVTRKLCQEYLASRKVKNSTVRRELNALGAALRWFDKNTHAVIELPPESIPRDRYITDDELNALLESCEHFHVQLAIVLASTTAARKGAILGLKWSDIDFQRGMIDYGHGDKAKKRAVVPMNRTCEHMLETAFRLRISDHVIEYNGNPVGDFKKSWASTVKRAGVKDITFHDLRHRAARKMAESNISMSEIAQYLGHSSSRITEKVYARYSPNFLKTASKALELGVIAPRGVAYHDS